MTEDRLFWLAKRRMAGDQTDAEALELDLWAGQAEANGGFTQNLTNEAYLEKEVSVYQSIDPARAFANWLNGRTRGKVLYLRALAAAVFVLITVCTWVLVRKAPVIDRQPVVVTQARRPSKPDRNKATLTLANGQLIQLDTTGKGEVALQGNTRVIKTDSGALRYEVSGQQPAVSAYNTLTIPKSGLYRLTLADGSRVWLNNESRLRYPTAFAADNRTVELSGEGYFEIVHDAHKPFIVRVKDRQVDVLGTSFNVAAYTDETGMRTTLVEGSIRIKTIKDSVQLYPDQQAQVDADGKLTIVKGVPAKDIAAWKNGSFYFGHGMNVAEIMRQLSRWYDVDVVIKGKVPNPEFMGRIDRSLTLNELIEFFNKNNMRLQLKGHTLYVSPN